MTTLKNIAIATLVVFVALPLAFLTWVYSATYHPAATENVVAQCPTDTPFYNTGQPLSVLSYNVQFFAGKNSVFYFDMPDNAGPDLRPDRKDIDATLDGIAQLIKEQDTDLVLLQEVHDDAAATDHQNQLEELLKRLPKDMYPCHSEAFYWQADYIPHPSIMGSVGMKLVTLSKYKLGKAMRYRLPQPPMDWVSAQFYLKRAILDTELLQEEPGKHIHILNTHFDAFAQGSDTMEQQVAIAKNRLQQLDEQNLPWIFAGDFNLLLPDQRQHLQDDQKYLYAEKTELSPILAWPHFPNKDDIQVDKERWLTHLPNDPGVTKPDRVIDYMFFSKNIQLTEKKILNQESPLILSDHFPVVGSFQMILKGDL